MINGSNIPTHILDMLIQWGSKQSGDAPLTETQNTELASDDQINRLHWRSWYAVTDDMSIEPHEALIRGLAFAEKEFNWCGGSVSAVIWTFRSFARKDPERADALAEWLLQYSDNPWVPFGSYRGSARSLKEIRIQNEVWQARREAVRQDEQKRQENAEARRQERALHGRRHVRSSAARSADRKHLIEDCQNASAQERLAQLVVDTEHPVTWFPNEWADVPDEELVKLPAGLIHGLRNRLADRQRGPWKQLLKRITEMSDPNSVRDLFPGDPW